MHRCGTVSVHAKAVLGTFDASLELRLKAGFKKRAGVAVLFSGSNRLNQVHDGSSWKVLKTSGNGPMVRTHVTVAPEALVLTNAETGDSLQKVVIVGAGIAGLSAAVALQRVGIKALVLETSSRIRASGTCMSLWGNAWRALDFLGAAGDLRENHFAITRMEMYGHSGNVLASFDLNDFPGGPHELRTVSRKKLVESLASQLPAESIQLNSRVRAIHRQPHDRLTKVELENGSVISTKVLVGCDGLHSVVGKWMGIPSTEYRGAVSILGLAEYPDGHNFGSIHLDSAFWKGRACWLRSCYPHHCLTGSWAQGKAPQVQR